MDNWPLVGDRYDPYDPAHPMWRDPFWWTYAARPTAPPPPTTEPAEDGSRSTSRRRTAVSTSDR